MDKKLNIWMISQFASTPNIPGMQRTYQYAKAFADMGHDVTFWRSSYNHWGKVETIYNDVPYLIDTTGNLKIIRLKTKPLYDKNDHKRLFNMIHFAYSLMRLSKKITPCPDVVIGAYPSPFAAFAANRIADRYKAKFILEIGDLWPQVWVERNAFPKYHPFILMLYKIERYLHKRTNLFVSSLPYVNDYLTERGVSGHKFLWVPNGINLDDFKTKESVNDLDYQDAPVKSILNIMAVEKQKGRMNVIYIGGIGVGNRVDCIAQAAKILRDKGEDKITFTIIGDGHSRKNIMQYVVDNHLDSVRIFPPIVRRSVPLVLKSADVGVLCLHDNPVYRYGVNLNKVYDYMAAGIPIVFSANVRNNLVEQYKAGISVPPSDPIGIAAALQKLMSLSAEERRLMGNRGHEAIAEDYNVRKLAKKYIDFIVN